MGCEWVCDRLRGYARAFGMYDEFYLSQSMEDIKRFIDIESNGHYGLSNWWRWNRSAERANETIEMIQRMKRTTTDSSFDFIDSWMNRSNFHCKFIAIRLSRAGWCVHCARNAHHLQKIKSKATTDCTGISLGSKLFRIFCFAPFFFFCVMQFLLISQINLKSNDKIHSSSFIHSICGANLFRLQFRMRQLENRQISSASIK